MCVCVCVCVRSRDQRGGHIDSAVRNLELQRSREGKPCILYFMAQLLIICGGISCISLRTFSSLQHGFSLFGLRGRKVCLKLTAKSSLMMFTVMLSCRPLTTPFLGFTNIGSGGRQRSPVLSTTTQRKTGQGECW